MVFVLCALIDKMGSLSSRHRHSPADPAENEQTAEIERRIEQEMEAMGEAKSIVIDKIMPPRLEDAGLEDCALPPESIREAFLKAASAVRSIVSASGDEDGCVEDPWEESSDAALVGITPSEGCVVEKAGGSTEAAGDRVAVGGNTEVKVDAVVVPGVPGGGEEA